MSAKQLRKELSTLEVFNNGLLKSSLEGHQSTHNTEKMSQNSKFGNRIASKDSVLFGWTNSKLWSHTIGQSQCKYLDVDISFEVYNVVLNNSGTLLALVGDSKIEVVVLPESSFFLDGSYSRRKARHKTVNPGKDTHIRKVLWNPIAQYDSNLVVLTDDRMVRAYDLSWNYTEPEQQLYLYPTDGKTYSTDFELPQDTLEDPISIALGVNDIDSNPLSCFTLYILSSDGNIFSVCPWVPSRFTMIKYHVDKLLDYSVLEHEDNLSSDSQKQILWSSDISNQCQKALVDCVIKEDGTVVDYYILERPSSKSKLRIQGPFLLQPYPMNLYDGCSWDIVSLKVGDYGCVAVSADSRRISIFLQMQTSSCAWGGIPLCPNTTDGNDDDNHDDKKIIHKEPKLALLESIQITAKQKENIFFHLCNNGGLGDRIMAYRDDLLYELSLENWQTVLRDSSFSEAAINHCPGTIITELLGDSDKSGFFGVALLKDCKRNSYTVVKSLCSIYVEGCKDLIPSSLSSLSSGDPQQQQKQQQQPGTPYQLRTLQQGNLPALNISPMRTAPEKKRSYKTLLEDKTSIQQVEQDLANINIEVPIISSSFKSSKNIQPTLAHFQYFVSLSTHFSEQLGILYSVGSALHDRLGLQREEMLRQLEKLKDLLQRTDGLKESSSHQCLEDALNRQISLQNRTDKLLEQVSKRNALLLSKKEQQWFAELRRLQNKVYGINGGLDTRLSTATKQVKVLSKELQLQLPTIVASHHQKQSGLEVDTIMKLRAMLSKEDDIVHKTKGSLEHLVAMLDTKEDLFSV